MFNGISPNFDYSPVAIDIVWLVFEDFTFQMAGYAPQPVV